jgi:hypothetical protein
LKNQDKTSFFVNNSIAKDSSKTASIEENVAAITLLLEKLRKERWKEQPNSKSLFLKDTYETKKHFFEYL